jgi:uncharacterized membrane protein (DUF2068 family)
MARLGRQKKSQVVGLRTVAAFEFAKGLLVALLGLGLVSMSHRGVDLEDITQGLLYVLHIDRGRHLSQVFLRAAERLDDVNLLAVAAGAAVYSMLRCVEAFGLWTGRVWAQWIALVSGAVYLPLEIYELIRKPTTSRWMLFSINLLIVAYMAYLRWRDRGRRSPA